MSELEGLGVKINSDVDKDAFIEATALVRERFGAKYSELLARIERRPMTRSDTDLVDVDHAHRFDARVL